MSTPVNDGGPAFPVSIAVSQYGQVIRRDEDGMRLRDYFAAKALPIVANDDGGTIEQAAKLLGIPTKEYDGHKHWPIIAARRAYVYADAMLSARAEGGKEGA